jgi:hypothetical protein
LQWRRIRIGFVYWSRAPHLIRQDRSRHDFGSMNWRIGGVEFSTERVMIAVLKMVRFGVRVRCGAHVLKIRFRERRLVSWEGVLGCATTAKENNRDERRENG